MTDPTPSRWTSLRARLAALVPRGAVSRLNPLTWASVAFGVALLIVLALWVNALTTPVHREGNPTTSVEPLPVPTTATPIPTPSGTPTSSGSSTPTAVTPTPSAPKMKSSGKFDTAAVNVAASGSAGTLHRYSVRVETSSKLDADKVGRQIADVLNDPRSWAGSGSVRFALVADPARADFTITLAAPGTATKLCTPEPDSCTDSGDVVIDAARWLASGSAFTVRAQWQTYLVNHAIGHLLGEQHQGCQKKGKLAPVMMPQDADLRGCFSNPWPFP